MNIGADNELDRKTLAMCVGTALATFSISIGRARELAYRRGLDEDAILNERDKVTKELVAGPKRLRERLRVNPRYQVTMHLDNLIAYWEGRTG